MVIMLIIQVPVVGWFALPMVVLFVIVTVTLALKSGCLNSENQLSKIHWLAQRWLDTMTAISTVKSFAGGESREDLNFGAVAKEWHRRVIDAWLTHVAIDFVRTNIRIVMMAGMLGLVIWLWYKGESYARWCDVVDLRLSLLLVVICVILDDIQPSWWKRQADCRRRRILELWRWYSWCPECNDFGVPEKAKGLIIWSCQFSLSGRGSSDLSIFVRRD